MNKTINITAPTNKLSYGYVGQNIIKAFIKSGVAVNLRLIGDMEVDEEAGYGDYIRKCGKQFEPGKAHLIIFHHFSLKELALPGYRNIGFPIFEINEFTSEEIDNFNSVDTIVVASKWYADILSKIPEIKKPIKIVPLGYDTDVFQPTPQPENEKVEFLHIGKWEIRKNQLCLLKAFNEEFKNTDDVSLTLVCDNPFISGDNLKWRNLAKYYVPNANILPCRFNSCLDVARLIRTSNVGIFVSRAEGWNLPLLETIASNRLAIATLYSAHTEFINSDNCQLIYCDQETSAFDGQFFHGIGTWAKWGDSQHIQLKAALRTSYEMIKEKKEIKGNVEQFTWENSVRKLMEIL